jgi:hypothetical protein
VPQAELERELYETLTTHTRRQMERADALGYDVDLKLHLGEENTTIPYGVEIVLRPRTNQARLRLTLKGLEGQAIRATAPFVRDDPTVDCIAIERAVDEALSLHDRWLSLVVA